MRYFEFTESFDHDPAMFRGFGVEHEDGDHLLPRPRYKASRKAERARSAKWSKGFADIHKQVDYAKVAKDDFKAVQNAVSDTSRFNHALIGKTGDHQERVEKLRHVIGRHATPLKHELHVYHGSRAFKPDVEVGGILEMPGFISTSLHPLRAKSFGFNILHFMLPQGYRNGIYLGASMQGEHEYLINCGTRWKVENIDEQKNVFHDHDRRRGYERSERKVRYATIWTLSPL